MARKFLPGHLKFPDYDSNRRGITLLFEFVLGKHAKYYRMLFFILKKLFEEEVIHEKVF